VKAYTVIELSDEEAKERLVNFYTDVLVNDRENTRDLIRDGRLGSAVVDLTKADEDKVAELFGELDLGRVIAEEQNASHVVIRTDDYKWEIVFDIDNVPPAKRWGPWRLILEDNAPGVGIAREDNAPSVDTAREGDAPGENDEGPNLDVWGRQPGTSSAA